MTAIQIHDQLYFSDEQTAANRDIAARFDKIVTVGYGTEAPETSTTGDRFWFPDGRHKYSTFEAAVDYVVDAIKHGDTVLVHCRNGVSRSSAVSTVALARVSDISLDEAFEIVTQKSERADPTGPIRESMEQYTGDELDDYRSSER